jgi:hypothetical protein
MKVAPEVAELKTPNWREDLGLRNLVVNLCDEYEAWPLWSICLPRITWMKM